MQHHRMQHGCPFSNVLILWFLQPCPLVHNLGRRFDDFVFIVCMVSLFSLLPCKYHLGQPCGTVSPVETSYKIQISYYLKDSGAQLTPRTKLILHTYLGMAHPKKCWIDSFSSQSQNLDLESPCHFLLFRLSLVSITSWNTNLILLYSNIFNENVEIYLFLAGYMIYTIIFDITHKL